MKYTVTSFSPLYMGDENSATFNSVEECIAWADEDFYRDPRRIDYDIESDDERFTIHRRQNTEWTVFNWKCNKSVPWLGKVK
jgi:hypothetical protein